MILSNTVKPFSRFLVLKCYGNVEGIETPVAIFQVNQAVQSKHPFKNWFRVNRLEIGLPVLKNE